MPHTSQRVRRTAARITTVAAATALLAAGITGIANAQSADAVGSVAAPGHDSTATHATITHDNLTVTNEIIGGNIGFIGDEIHYRTTISATDGPSRQVTEILQIPERYDPCGFRKWLIPLSGAVTYTNQAGERVTESTPNVWGGAVGSWAVDPAADSTVVYDTVYQLNDPTKGPAIGCGRTTTQSAFVTGPDSVNLESALRIDADGLDTLTWSPTGVTVTCVLNCQIPGPAGSVELLFFGS